MHEEFILAVLTQQTWSEQLGKGINPVMAFLFHTIVLLVLRKVDSINDIWQYIV